MKLIREEKEIGVNFAQRSGISPLILQLVKLDKLPALRFIVISRKILYSFFIPTLSHDIKKANPQKDFNTHDIIAELNTKILSKYGDVEIKPKQINERKFWDLIAIMQNTVLLYLLENIDLTPKKKIIFEKELKKLFKVLNIVYGASSIGQDSQEPGELIEILYPEKANEQTSATVLIEDDLGVIPDKIQKEENERDNQFEDDTGEDKVDEILLTREEVAAIYKITLPTLRDWEKKGSIPGAIRIGGRVYFKKTDIMDHINNANQTK